MSDAKQETALQSWARPDVKRFLCVLLSVLLGLVAYWGPFASSPTASKALGVTIFMLVMFITEPIPLGVTGLLGCWLFWIWVRVPAGKAFIGFTNDAPWFVFGALLLGIMAETTGLARRLAYNLICRLGSNYSVILVGMMVLNFLLTFLVPSGVARVTLLCTISIGMIQSYGMAKNSNIARGLMLAMTYQGGLYDKMIIAGAGSILARGLIEQFGKVSVSYGLWLIAYLPGVVLTIVASWYIILKLFPPEKLVLEGGAEYCRSELKKMGPMSAGEIKALIIMLLATLLFATDFLHHINASIIGLGAGLVACLPMVGALKSKDFSKVNVSILLFQGGVLTMGYVISDTGVLKTLTAVLFKWMTPVLYSSSFLAAPLLYVYANVFHLFLGNEGSMVSATMPALMDFALKNGFNPVTLGMVWGFSIGGKVFVYQSSVLIVGYAFGTFTAKDLFKLGIVLFFVEAFMLMVLVPLYWPLIGLTFK
ncbi:MAG TPA: SLC13 family permease [Syntrophorhabdales bacterium]|nr:SLC13 family permease [Syntrophorhabdales bacterium]